MDYRTGSGTIFKYELFYVLLVGLCSTNDYVRRIERERENGSAQSFIWVIK